MMTDALLIGWITFQLFAGLLFIFAEAAFEAKLNIGILFMVGILYESGHNPLDYNHWGFSKQSIRLFKKATLC